MALIDVLLPVYNGGRFLEASLESIARQTLEDFRCLILDDGSTDGSEAVYGRYCEADPRFVAHRKDNTGLIDTLNFGLGLVEAPLVARSDADDVNVHDRFERQAAYLDNSPLSVAVGGRQYVVDEHDRVLKLSERHKLKNVDPYALPAQEPYLPHPFVMIRSDVLRNEDIAYRNFLHAEDADLYWRLSRHGVLYNLEDYVGYYRVHTASVSANAGNARIQMMSAALAALSQQRILEGRDDITVADELPDRMREASGSFDSLLDAIGGDLPEAERCFLGAASAVKYFQFSHWRPYDPEPGDLDFLAAHSTRAPWLKNEKLASAVACYLVSLRRYGGFRWGQVGFQGLWNLFRFSVYGVRATLNKLFTLLT